MLKYSFYKFKFSNSFDQIFLKNNFNKTKKKWEKVSTQKSTKENKLSRSDTLNKISLQPVTKKFMKIYFIPLEVNNFPKSKIYIKKGTE